MRGTGCLMLFIAVVAFTPIGVQVAVIELLRPVVTSDGGQLFALGLLGGVVGALLAHAAIWNAAMKAVYLEDLKKADETYQRRRKK